MHRLPALVALSLVTSVAASARADEPAAWVLRGSALEPAPTVVGVEAGPGGRPYAVAPPPSPKDWLQVGAAMASESVTGTGGICPDKAREACILGSGGGVALRAGRRFSSGVWVGGVYAFSRHDAANLIKLPILQQLRVEGRYYLREGYRLTPYASAAGGIGAYGSEWRAETFGPLGSLGLGVEWELTQQVYAGISFAYRTLLLSDWVDSAGQSRGGLAQIVGVELTLETRGPFERW